MKVCIYARVSTEDHDQDPTRQFAACERYADQQGHEIVARLQEHWTGDSHPDERPIASTIPSLNVDRVLVYSMDRLSRQHPGKVLRLLEEYKARGILVVSVTEPIFNMESEFAEPLRFFIAWFNNWYLTKLRRDINSGIERARKHGTKSGKQIGRAPREFNRYRAAKLLRDGVPLRAIAAEVGVSPATVLRFKTSPEFLAGKYLNEQSV